MSSRIFKSLKRPNIHVYVRTITYSHTRYEKKMKELKFYYSKSILNDERVKGYLYGISIKTSLFTF